MEKGGLEVLVEFMGFEIRGGLNGNRGIEWGRDGVIDWGVEGKWGYGWFMRGGKKVVWIEMKRVWFWVKKFWEYGRMDGEGIGKFEGKVVRKIEGYWWCGWGLGIDSWIGCWGSEVVRIGGIFWEMWVGERDDNGGFLWKGSYWWEEEKD